MQYLYKYDSTSSVVIHIAQIVLIKKKTNTLLFLSAVWDICVKV